MIAGPVLVIAALLIQLADPQADERIRIARTLVHHMSVGEFEKTIDSFDETMKKGLPPGKLKEVWQSITSQYGAFRQASDSRTDAKHDVVFVTTEFERGILAAKVAFDADNRIAGLFFVPTGEYRSPPYVKPLTFEELDVTVGTGPLPLTGTLSLPKGDGPFPAITLVHGSGPHDRDESIGPNKPFRDLAQGLASQGIAVVRYEKRTKQHHAAVARQAGTITVKQETVDDAAAAVDALYGHERIDRRKIFVLGHSLGGMLLPRIVKANEKIAGVVVLAGSARPLEDLVLEQTKYILSLGGQATDEQKRHIERLEQQVARVKSAELSPQTQANELPLGIHAAYWLDLRGYDPAEAAKTITKPMLILQGERDYQVTMDDFARWKAALASVPQAKFLSYPALNHLFIEGRGKSSPAEYSSPGNVAAVVISDIATWIKAE